MGGIVWNEWARLMCLSGSFIIFVGGIVGTFEPLPAFDAMRKLPALYNGPVPILPVILIVLGMIIAAVEYPFVVPEYFSSSRSFMPRVACYIPLAVMALLEAQTVNGGLYLSIGTVAYLLAIRDDFRKQQAASWGRLS
ncbi:hypothetical protein EDD21DRAFT_19689 [Dissophora ornata]|nr:hypothetical protein BGZ58_001519 [Dissophora ornata]KAI8595985.1 hypothetical protein EDD21DRAFT_19689 [Dissophora ornata]